jgi:hypothetical protein
VLASRRPLWLSGRRGSKAKLAKDPKDDKAAKKRKSDSVREAQREEKIVNMNEKRLAEDEAKLEAQRPGVMNDVKLWQVLDGQAMRFKLNYPSAELRNALKAQGKSDRTRALPQLVLAVKDAYGWAS